MQTTRSSKPGHETAKVPEDVNGLLERVQARRELPKAEERRRIRKAAGVSQRELGRALGVSWTAIQRWESGSRPRQRSHVVEYRRALDGLRQLAEDGDRD
jgi:DNA-binding transcriptional regulator YiaG